MRCKIHRYPDDFVHLTPWLSFQKFTSAFSYVSQKIYEEGWSIWHWSGSVTPRLLAQTQNRLLIVVHTQRHNTDPQLCTPGNHHWHIHFTFKSHILMYYMLRFCLIASLGRFFSWQRSALEPSGRFFFLSFSLWWADRSSNDRVSTHSKFWTCYFPHQ